jgi:hypothetical protein
MELKLRWKGKRLVLLIAAGVAYATIPDSQGVIHACYDKQAGQVRIVDTGPNAVPKGCGQSEVAISWNRAGPPGPVGPQGPAGPQGSAGTADAYAGIREDGTVNPANARGITDANVTHPRTGVYCIGGLAFTPRVGIATGHAGLTTDSSGAIVPNRFDEVVTIALAVPPTNISGSGCSTTDQVRIYNYRIGGGESSPPNSLSDNGFYILLDD